MIRFSCRCGHVFDEPDNAAGSGVQCPQCFLLNDVPLLSVLRSFNPDGTYKTDEGGTDKASSNLDDLLYVYSKSKVDSRGAPIDLRNDPSDLARVGGTTNESAAPKSRPRYDPETGERIDAIPLASGANANTATAAKIPFAKPAVSYATRDTPRPGGSRHVLLELFAPMSLVVMFFVLLVHLLLAALTVTLALKLFLFAPFYMAAAIALLAHYGNVVDEIAVEERDELPTVLRDVRLREDIFGPALAVVTTLALCYAPAVLTLALAPLSLAAAGALAAALALVGTFLLPATLLTLLTSGSISNLRPDRVLAVIHQAGGRYFLLVGAFFFSAIPYLWGLAGLSIKACDFAKLNLNAGMPEWTLNIIVVVAVMSIGIYGMHFCCWSLGALYRQHESRFPWVGRYHVREDRPPVQRTKPNYVTPPPVES